MFAGLRKFLHFQLDLPKTIDISDSKHLDLGCGATPRNPFGARYVVGTDFATFDKVNSERITFVTADLTNRLPFESNTFNSISSFDVLEHIPRWERSKNGTIEFPFVNLMSEVFRVLAPGGFFLAITPAYPSPASFQDPTHVNFVSQGTLAYFTNPTSHAKELGYGFNGSFEVVYESWLRGVGPFSNNRLTNERNLRSISGVIAWLKLLRRLIRAITNRKPTHLIWVLQKPNQTEI